jgi:methionyl-tRNA synthetase
MTEERPQGAAEISIEEFSRIDLRVARVLSAETIPGATRLLKLTVDLGEERQLVAGIAEAYAPEDLVGKNIIVVANLKPARLRGVESNGMLLAATPPGGKPVLAIFDQDLPPGTRVK